MDFENDAVCEKIINEIDLVFLNDSDLYVPPGLSTILSLFYRKILSVVSDVPSR